jgi:hypothetical protein
MDLSEVYKQESRQHVANSKGSRQQTAYSRQGKTNGFLSTVYSLLSTKKKNSLSTTYRLLSTDQGIALVMVLILSAIALAIMAGLIYMLTTGTQISGMEKRYKTALEAGIGGADVIYQFIGMRGEQSKVNNLLGDLSSLGPLITTPATCQTNVAATLPDGTPCITIGNYTDLATKLNLPTACWTGCDSSLTITHGTPSTYDMSLNLGVSTTYTAYAKIVDTVWGNTGEDEGLVDPGFPPVPGSSVVPVPYLYTIEVDAQDTANPSERAKLSILYQY